MSAPDENDSSGGESGARPTRVRHLIVFVTVLMAVILYLDRYCVSFSERYIKQDLGLHDWQMDWFISAFFWSYALAQVPAGWLGDRFGSRGILALYIISWSLFTAATGLAAGFVMLLVMRLGCGLGQAGAYPTSGSLLSRWVPLSRRALASGLVSLGGRFGAVLAPILTAFLIVLFVPLSTPATLDESAILDGPGLCGKIVRGNDVTPARHAEQVRHGLQDLMPDEAQWIVVRYGTLAQAYHKAQRSSAETSREQAGEEERSLAAGQDLRLELPQMRPEEIQLEPSELRTLAAALNSLMTREGLFSADDIGPLSLEREAIEFLSRREHGDHLSPAETVRFNRFIFEALFPSEIKKLYVQGWRPVLFVYGFAGLMVAAVFWACFRNSPVEHPRCNAAEQRLITGGKTSAKPQASGERFPAREILRSPSLWLSSVSQFGTNFAWMFFVTSLPRYLMEVHQVPILERSWMVSMPALAGIVGMFLGGWLTDALTRRIGLRWGRGLPMAVTRFGAAAAYLACLKIESPWMATAAFAAAFFFVDLGVSAVWAFMQDVGGKNVGAVLGWGNMWGNFGSAVANPLYGILLGSNPQSPDWNRVFVMCAAVFTVSGIAALGIDATVTIVATSGKPGAGSPEDAV